MMRRFLAALLVAGGVPAVPASQTAIPGTSGERLRYSVNWPSGLGLGELDISASRASGDAGKPGNLKVDATLDASVPALQVTDQYKSEATGDFCSVQFEKSFKHGTRGNDEVTTFDQKNNTLTRETKVPGGGKSDLSTAHCAKDALTFLYFLRNELANGRLPQQQTIYFGAPYSVRLDFGGARRLKVGGAMMDTDRITAAVRGPASDFTVEIFFAHDAVRTPVLVRAPASIGTLTAELMK